MCSLVALFIPKSHSKVSFLVNVNLLEVQVPYYFHCPSKVRYWVWLSHFLILHSCFWLYSSWLILGIHVQIYDFLQYTWPRLGDPWCLTCVSICCTGSLHMLGNGNFLDRIFNHAFASPPCHKRSFSLPAMYLPTYPFRLWITKITVTKILGWDVYQDVSLSSCLATLNVLSAYAVISLSKIPLTQTEYVKTFPGKVSCYDLSFCPSWKLNTAEMETSSWYAMKQETRLVGDMKQWWRCCKTPGSPVSLLMKV